MVNSFDVSGRLRALRDTLRKQLIKKFEPLPEPVANQLSALTAEQLEEKLLAILDAQSLKDMGLTDE